MKIIEASNYERKTVVEYGTPEQNAAVQSIIAEVKRDKDAALKRYAKQFDKIEIDHLRVSDADIEAAYGQVEEDFLAAIRRAAANIRSFHEKQRRTSWMEPDANGTVLGQVLRPLKRVGLYVPGGTAAYPSSVLMNVIPAQVAGVKEIAIVTPPSTAGGEGINPYILVAAAEVGVREIYRVGGAQAVAALAYGTESIAPVDKICGPGNIYVALAKRYVYGIVDIDSIAGPSDICVLADETADASYVAADLLSQAEHDVLATAILVTPSRKLAEEVQQELIRQTSTLPRKEIVEQSLANNGEIWIVNDLAHGVEIVNQIAPEHLELLVDQPLSILGSIENAGAIFLGAYSSEPVGDYYAGPNHVLPTGGTARFSSPLNVDDFMKKSSIVSYSKQALFAHADDIMKLARYEGLEAHARAIEIRLTKEGDSK
jgi:histidinol dehydrogenase